MSKELEKILAKLEQLLPPPPPPTDWKASIAFRWRKGAGGKNASQGWLQPVRHVHRIRLSDLRGIGPQIERVELTQATGTFAVAVTSEPASVTLDPNTWVLLQAVEFVKR